VNLSSEQIQIVKTVVNEFLPIVGHSSSADKILNVVLNYAGGNANKAMTRCELRTAIGILNQEPDDEQLNMFIDTANNLASGYLRWVEQKNIDELDIYPASQLFNLYKHAEAVDWLQKWRDNGGRVFERNEMIALKNDPIWIRISAFHLPFPPFDLDSGMDVDGVPRREAEKLGLISSNQMVEPMSVDLNFGSALRQRLMEYLNRAVQKQSVDIAL
jgi:hypothetical protein